MDQDFTLILISRRDKRRVGTRFLSRGCNLVITIFIYIYILIIILYLIIYLIKGW